MSGTLSRSLRSSPSFMKIVEEEMMTLDTSRPTTAAAEKQGIVVAILGSDDGERVRAGLRRTLSADMSSKKWLAENGFFSPMKKIASSEELSLPALNSFSSSDEEEEEEEDMNRPGQFDIWNTIQEEKKKKKSENEKLSGEFDIWSSIISQKENGIESSKSLPPPYIHPLVKRSTSSLSEKSLQICTESLGSETGSDGFSSYPSSESSSDAEADQKEVEEEEEEEEQLEEKQVLFDRDQEEYRPVKFNYTGGRNYVTRSFPPPLPSLSRNDGSPTLRMRTRRDNGRLVMEAVSMASPKNFLAQRRDGRLVLTFVKSTNVSDDDAIAPTIEEENKEKAEEFEDFEEENEEEEEEDFEQVFDEKENYRVKRIEMETEEEEALPKLLSTRPINFHRLALMVNKPIGLPNRNISATAWPNNLEEEEEEEEEEEVEEEEQPTPAVIAQSLPPRPRPVGRLPQTVPKAPATTAASFNAYEYFWRRAKPMATAAAGIKISTTNMSLNDNKLIVSKNQTTNDSPLGDHWKQQVVVLRGNKGDYLVPLLKGCKEPRRTLFWKPYCIATS
ncbi:hypothetical protein TIFTF001_016083 [Ficus carica]|uniref:FAF domain-containing protein n=1 Tax=Ficus carica TaxID=3494 RepID=A0AA88A8C2_FICCA|nr:hypothetical protein TIFTF001_016083 [Ficus carica]